MSETTSVPRFASSLPFRTQYWTIMEYLWDNPDGVSLKDIQNALRGRVYWTACQYQNEFYNMLYMHMIDYKRIGRTRYFFAVVNIDVCIRHEIDCLKMRLSERAFSMLVKNLMFTDREKCEVHSQHDK